MTPLEKSLISHFKCNDAAASKTVTDSQGYSNGTSQRNTSLMHVDGIGGGAFLMNGSADYFDFNKNGNSVFQKNFTINLFCKPDDSYPQGVVTVFGTDTQPATQIKLAFTQSTGRIGFYYQAGNEASPTYISKVYFTPGEGSKNKIMITAMVEQIDTSTVKLSIYINGELWETATGTQNMGDFSSSRNFLIGAFNDPEEVTYPFAGIIDNVMIFQKVLEPDEILFLYNNGEGRESLSETMLPVVELIAMDLEASINAVTTANGYHQDLTAHRPKNIDFSDSWADRDVLIVQDNNEKKSAQGLGLTERNQYFLLEAIVRHSEKATESIDTRLNQIEGDIEKKLITNPSGSDRGYKRGGYAVDTEIMDFQFTKDEGLSSVLIRVRCGYRHKENDPYTQG